MVAAVCASRIAVGTTNGYQTGAKRPRFGGVNMSTRYLVKDARPTFWTAYAEVTTGVGRFSEFGTLSIFAKPIGTGMRPK